jgi:hypothetical protein
VTEGALPLMRRPYRRPRRVRGDGLHGRKCLAGFRVILGQERDC